MENRFEKLVSLLETKGYRICAAESCTGGLFAAGVVSVANASHVLDRSFVTYSEEAKCELVGVDPAVIENCGVVSVETAAQMALGAAKAAGAAVGVGVTGFAGPGGGDRFAPVCTVCFGFAVNGRVVTEKKYFPGLGRNEIRRLCADFACDRLTALLQEA